MRGTLNIAELYVGPPGCGKSYALAARARDLGRQLGAYVIAHDLTNTFAGADVRRHGSADELAGDLKAHPGGIHVLIHEEGGEAVRVALEIAAAAEKAGTPVVLVLDEATAVDGMSPHHLSPALKRAWAMRRHKNMAVLVGTQYPAQVHPQLWMSATRLTLFRIDSERARRALVRDAGVPRELAERTARLELVSADARARSQPRQEGRHYVTVRR